MVGILKAVVSTVTMGSINHKSKNDNKSFKKCFTHEDTYTEVNPK